MKVQNYSENLEKHLVQLGHDVARLKESPENNDLSERELVKQSLRSLAQTENDVTGAEPTSPAPAVPAASPADNFLPNYLSGNPDEGIKKSVEHLLQVAAGGDLPKAAREARRYPPFIEDAFHDALVDKFMPELKKRGIIK